MSDWRRQGPPYQAPVPSPVPAVPYWSLPDWVLKIAKAIFETKIRETEPYPEGWRIWLGEGALMDFKRVQPEGVKVGIVGLDGTKITESGRVTYGSILGIEIYPDSYAPLDQWRLSDAVGRTLAQGVWRE